MEPIYPVPFEAIGVVDFNTVPIVKGQEYEITAVSADGTRWQTYAPDGRPGWFPAKYCVPIADEPVYQQPQMSRSTSQGAYQQQQNPYSQQQYVQQQQYSQQPQYGQQAAYGTQPTGMVRSTSQSGGMNVTRTPSTSQGAQGAGMVRSTSQSGMNASPGMVRSTSQSEIMRQREEQRKAEEARKAAMRMKVESKSSTRNLTADGSSVEDLLAELQLDSQEAPVSPRQPQLQTYAASKGYLAAVPAFDANLSTYSPVSPRQAQPEPAPVAQRTQPQQQQQPIQKSGMYVKLTPQEEPAIPFNEAEEEEEAEEGPWRCGSCSTVQPIQAQKCTMCGSAKPNNAAAVYVPEEAGDRPFEEDWKCPRCSVTNDRAGLRCNMCGGDRPKFDPAVMRRQATSPKSSVRTAARPGVPGAKPKKKIVSKASSGVELEYAKKVDVFNYKSGSAAVPGHGASY